MVMVEMIIYGKEDSSFANNMSPWGKESFSVQIRRRRIITWPASVEESRVWLSNEKMGRASHLVSTRRRSQSQSNHQRKKEGGNFQGENTESMFYVTG